MEGKGGVKEEWRVMVGTHGQLNPAVLGYRFTVTST